MVAQQRSHSDKQRVETLTLTAYAAQALHDLRPLLAGFAGVLGLIVGSFLNVVIYRVPAGLSIVAPRSACPRCQTPIRSYDNIPLVSWLVLRAKCRTCAAPISARYPAIETITATLFAGLTWWGIAQSPAMVPALLYMSATGIALFMIDWDTMRLPDAIVKPSYAVLAVLLAGAGWLSGQWQITPMQALCIGAVLAWLGAIDLWAERLGLPYVVEDNAYPVGTALLATGAILSPNATLNTIGGAMALWLAVFWLPWILTRGRGMGLGDVKLAPLLGAVLGAFGWGPAIIGLLVAFVYGAIIGAAFIRRRPRAATGSAEPAPDAVASEATAQTSNAGPVEDHDESDEEDGDRDGDVDLAQTVSLRKTMVPFGPSMLAGALSGLLAGAWLFDLYLSVSGIA